MSLNKREKGLLIVTGVVVLATIVSLLIRSDETVEADEPVAPASVDQPEPAPPTVSPESAETVVPAAVEGTPVFITQLELQRQLDRATRLPLDLTFEDPFRIELVERAKPAPRITIRPADLPVISGLFYSSATDRGAVLNGELVFLGGEIGLFRLSGVDGGGVVLEAEGREYRIEYDPLGGSGPAERNP